MENEILKVVNKVPHAVFVAKALDILYVNPKGLDLIACNEAQLKGLKFTDFIHPEDLDLFNNRSFKLDADATIGLRFKDFNKEDYWVEISCETVNWEGDGVDMYFVSDLSKPKVIEKQLQDVQESAEQISRLESSFLAHMSHAIKTPLNTIIGCSQLLPHDDVSEQLKNDYYQLIEENSHQLLDLVDDIMDWSQIETGHLKINKSVFAVNGFFAELKSRLEEDLSQLKFKKEVSLVFKTPVRSDGVNINTDRMRLKQILMNLMNNALKFTDKGQVVIGYRVLDRNSLEFYVKDTGIGIQKSKQSHVFKHNYNINTLSKSKQKGSSLALAITKSLTELLGGDISFVSEYGKGSVFTFRLPYKTEIRGLKKITRAGGNIPAYIDWSQKSILIVEDEVSNYLFIKEALKRTKVKLSWVENGAEAIQFLETGKAVDLILMDLHMPVMNGYEAKIKISAMGLDIPIIAQTAYAIAEEKKRILDLGFSSYIAKPIQVSNLIGLISDYL